jgi:transposase
MKSFLGIDVSKGYADFALLNEQKQPLIKSFQLDDTPDGHSKLGEFIRELLKNNPEMMLLAAVESTGGYENNWLTCLKKMQRCYSIKIARLNPKGVHHYFEAKLNRTITDSLSARMIAEYMISHWETVHFDQLDEMYSLRKQWTLIRMLSKQKTQLLNNLNNLVYQANPELLMYCRAHWPDWLLNLLKHFPTAKELSAASINQLVEISYVTKDKAEKIKLRAQQSVASATDEVSRNMIRTVIEELIHKQQLIESCKKQMIETCSILDVDLVSSIPGIGKYSAVGLIIEIGTWLRFRTVKQLAAFFGLHPILKQSGDKIWIVRMSKQGSAEVRAILFMATLVAIRHNPVIRELYARSLAKGKCKMSAIGICMHKLLRIVYGVLKSGKPFDANVDHANRSKKPVQEKSAPPASRRFQPMDENAPVSARQNKKRKERTQSQDDPVIQCEITAPTLSRCVS